MRWQFATRVREGLRLLRDMRLIAASGLFDRAWYLAQNPDVAQARVDPIRHYLRKGASEGRDPNPVFDSDWYLEQNPDAVKTDTNPLVHYVRWGVAKNCDPSPSFDTCSYVARNPAAGKRGVNPLAYYLRLGGKASLPATVDGVLRQKFVYCSPLKVFSVPGMSPRITVVTDSMSQSSLFGGEVPAIIFGALLATRSEARLRIITRRERADQVNFKRILQANGIDWQKNVEFVYAHAQRDSLGVDIGDEDVFLTTSWWTTVSVQEVVPEEKIIYLLQDDERMFYPLGDQYLRCTETLNSSKIKFVVNSKLLYSHLVAEGFDHLQTSGFWFEPSFPKTHFFPDIHRENNKKNFMFYARPNNLRNLYCRGREVVGEVLRRGILDPKDWNVYFVGADLHSSSFSQGCHPQILQNLEWSQYAALLRRMDVGLSLTYTPHPSYTPLDLAACGAVVVTNQYGLKQSLDFYSKNILCRDVGMESLVEGIVDAVALSNDRPLREANYLNSNLLDDWNLSFDKILQDLRRE